MSERKTHRNHTCWGFRADLLFRTSLSSGSSIIDTLSTNRQNCRLIFVEVKNPIKKIKDKQTPPHIQNIFLVIFFFFFSVSVPVNLKNYRLNPRSKRPVPIYYFTFYFFVEYFTGYRVKTNLTPTSLPICTVLRF